MKSVCRKSKLTRTASTGATKWVLLLIHFLPFSWECGEAHGFALWFWSLSDPFFFFPMSNVSGPQASSDSFLVIAQEQCSVGGMPTFSQWHSHFPFSLVSCQNQYKQNPFHFILTKLSVFEITQRLFSFEDFQGFVSLYCCRSLVHQCTHVSWHLFVYHNQVIYV